MAGWTLSAQRGRVVLVNFWATWCSPCVAELPTLIRTANRYGGHGLKVAGISMDDNALALLPKYIKRFQIPYPVLACFPEAHARSEDRPSDRCAVGYSPAELPRTLLLDRFGRIARVYDSYWGVSGKRLDSDVRQLLRER